MKIGILQCDRVLDELNEQFCDYPQMFIQRMRRVESELTFSVYNIQAGQYPELDDCDAYITTGSRHGVNDDLEWVRDFRRFIAFLDKAKKKCVGICFGHQLIASVLGGEVVRSHKGWGVGIAETEVVAVQPWMKPPVSKINMLVSHKDQVITLPEQAEVLLRSNFCPYFMVQYSPHMMSLQGHPEFSREYSAALMQVREKDISTDRVEDALESLYLPLDGDLMMSWIIRFLKAQ